MGFDIKRLEVFKKKKPTVVDAVTPGTTSHLFKNQLYISSDKCRYIGGRKTYQGLNLVSIPAKPKGDVGVVNRLELLAYQNSL